MWSLICLHLLVAATGQVHGIIEFNLAALDMIDACGKLRCVDDTTSNVDLIKSFTIRKQLDSDVVLVQMDQKRPFFRSNESDRKYKGIWAMGTLSPHRAEAQITLYNAKDCNNAAFICESVHLSKSGVESVSSSSGRINGKLGPQQRDMRSSLTDLERKIEQLTKSDNNLKKLLGQIQEKISSSSDLESKIEQLTKSDSKIKNKLEQLKEKTSSSSDLESKIEQLTKSDSKIKSKLGQLQEKTSSLGDLERKIEQLTKSDSKIKSKLGQLQEKTSSLGDLKSKVEELTKSNQKILSRQLPTTCSKHVISSQERYLVVHPLDGTSPYLCDTDGGWTVIQRRIDGKTDFNRNWSSYKHGFGSFNTDFWLGLERIHNITSNSNQELRVTMKFKGKLYFAHYDYFRLSGENQNYKLSIGGYSGTAGDSLAYHNNMQFSTKDRDNDADNTLHCARHRKGAWWYKNCVWSNLNGLWKAYAWDGLMWNTLTKERSTTMTEMKIRKKL